MRRTEGVVQRTGHPHNHDNADAHGNANPCEHVGHLRVGRRPVRLERLGLTMPGSTGFP
jgi:hypothetical protein